jgi:hypothetical protein
MNACSLSASHRFLHPLCLGLALLVSFAPDIRAAEEKKEADEPSDDWIQTYYRKPTPERLEKEMAAYAKQGALHNEDAVLPLASFLGRVFAQNEKMLPQWRDFFLTLDKKDQPVFATALWMAGTKPAQEMLTDLAKREDALGQRATKLLRNPPMGDLRHSTARAPGDLDMCWGAFFATGDKGYALVVIRSAATPAPPKTIDMTQQAAKWSLNSLARTHPRIQQIRDEFLKTASEEQKRELEPRK